MIEIYQKKCNNEPSQIICIIPSDEILSFGEFTDTLINNCLNINDSNSKWVISNNVASGQLKNQKITVTLSDVDKRGSLPNNSIKGNINYYIFSSSTSVSVARFLVSFTCQNGSFENDNCKCGGN